MSFVNVALRKRRQRRNSSGGGASISDPTAQQPGVVL